METQYENIVYIQDPDGVQYAIDPTTMVFEVELVKDLWIYEQNAQIVKYIVGETQKPL